MFSWGPVILCELSNKELQAKLSVFLLTKQDIRLESSQIFIACPVSWLYKLRDALIHELLELIRYGMRLEFYHKNQNLPVNNL
jgi:hypothetical protein